MEHVVFHPGPDGAPAFRRLGTLEDAVRFVEHLRNVEGVEDVSVHLLTPVPLAFRAYYTVEVPAVDTVAVPTQPLATEPVMPEPVIAEPVMAEPVMPAETVLAEPTPADVVPETEAAVAANGKKTLGFFAH
jgi:hypothetical protein